MGTSASSTGPNNKSPLLPPWAEQGDSVEVGTGDADGHDGADGNEPSQEVDNGKIQEQIPGPVPNIPSPNRLQVQEKHSGITQNQAAIPLI